MRILVVEDEPKIREVLIAYLRNEGWEVEHTCSGREALAWFGERTYDLVLLDLMLEELPGEEVCREIRRSSTVPIIMLTAKSREQDTIEGLNLGADDYIAKPFRVKEVVARIHALLRRVKVFVPETRGSSVLTFEKGGLVLDVEAKTLIVRGVLTSLTLTEFKLMSVLAERPGKLFSRTELTQQVLGYRFVGDSRSIDTHVKNLRKKIEEDAKEPRYILTMVGAGYKFAAEPDDRKE